MPEPVAVQARDILTAEIHTFSMDRIFWKWDSTIVTQAGQWVEFSQSDFQISRDEAMINADHYVPRPSVKGEIAKKVLQACSGQRTIWEIDQDLHQAYQERFGALDRAIRKTKRILMGKVV